MFTRHYIYSLLSVAFFLQAANGASLSFALSPPGGFLAGAPGTTVGWGFTLTEEDISQWDIVTSAGFSSSSSIGTFTPFNFPLVIGSGAGNVNPYTEAFVNSNNILSATGVGRYVISAAANAGDAAAGNLVLTYSAFRTDPTNDPNFDPSGDHVFDGTVSAPASVFVNGTLPGGVPEPASLLLSGFGTMGLLAAMRRNRS